MDRIDKIKNHLREHKTEYFAAIGGLAVGALAVFAATRGDQSANVSGVVIGKGNTLIQTTILTRRGHPGNVIRCNETGEIYASQNRVAETLGVNPSRISEHLNGKLAHVNGLTFANLGEAY